MNTKQKISKRGASFIKLLKDFFIVLLILLISIPPNLAFAEESTENKEVDLVNQETEEMIDEDLDNPSEIIEKDSSNNIENDHAEKEIPSSIENINKNNINRIEQKNEVQTDQEISNLNEYNSTSSVVFKYNDRNDEIIDMKYKLMKIGFGTHWKKPTNYYGKDTVNVVKEFQTYYKIKQEPDGVMDEESFARLNEEVNSHYQLGNRSQEILEFKLNLMLVGYGTHWNNPTNYYGHDTEKVVKEFQKDKNLVENGIVDSVTLKTIEKLVLEIQEKGFSIGMKSTEIQKLKQDLMKAGFGTHWKNPTSYFGPDTEKVVKEFQEYYNINPITGALDPKTQSKLKEILSSPYQKGNRSQDILTIKLNLMKVGFGTHWRNPTNYYGPDTENVVKEFQKANRLVANGIIDEISMKRLEDLLAKNFSRGMASKQILDLKLDLIKAGFGAHWKKPTNYYGTDTEKVVKEFQTYYKLNNVDGKIYEETLKKLEEILNSPFQKGKSSSKIKELKINLMKLGFGTHWKNPTTYYGSDTEKVVKEFQKEYKLTVNGIMDEVTLEKMDELLAIGFKRNDRSKEIVKLKYDLMKAGFGTHWKNPTTYYGEDTEKVVKEFQAYYSLYVDGEMRLGTLNKLKEVINSPYQKGKSSAQIKKLKENLRIIGFGRHWKNPTNFYGDDTEKVVKEFQEAYGLVVNGIIDEVTLEKINQLIQTTRYTNYNITLKKALEIQMKTNPQTDKKYAYVSKKYIQLDKTGKKGIVTASLLNVRKGPGTSYGKITQLEKGTEVEIEGQLGDFYAIKYNHGTWVSALERDVLYYLNPLHFDNDPVQRFQFLDLSRLSYVSSSTLNNYLKGKGTLEGQGQTFVDAGVLFGVNEVYLVAHALLETGHGKSLLASGKIKVGKISNTRHVVVIPSGSKKGTYIVDYYNNSNKRKITKNDKYNLNGITLKSIYNMFGIMAYDSNPEVLGAVRAFEGNWFSPEAAIRGGAKFIRDNYINVGQNTLYKMRWNPLAMEQSGQAQHQYATDIGWAEKQTRRIYQFYIDFEADYYFEIPVYK